MQLTSWAKHSLLSHKPLMLLCFNQVAPRCTCTGFLLLKTLLMIFYTLGHFLSSNKSSYGSKLPRDPILSHLSNDNWFPLTLFTTLVSTTCLLLLLAYYFVYIPNDFIECLFDIHDYKSVIFKKVPNVNVTNWRVKSDLKLSKEHEFAYHIFLKMPIPTHLSIYTNL